jgi:hypothetical protein
VMKLSDLNREVKAFEIPGLGVVVVLHLREHVRSSHAHTMELQRVVNC